MNLSNLCAEFSKCTSPESKLEIVTKMILLQEKSIEEYARKHFYVQRMSYEDLKMAAIQRILEVIPRLEESDPSRIMAIFFNSMIYAMYDEFRLNNYSCCLNNYAGYRINKEKIGHVFADGSYDGEMAIDDLLSQDINPEETTFGISPEEQMIKIFELEQLQDLLGKLTIQDKNIILDIFEGEMTYEQIAKKYDLTIGTLYKRRQRILKKLKAMWE